MKKRGIRFSVVFALLCSFVLMFSIAEVKAAGNDYMGYAVFKGGYYGPQEQFGNEDFDGGDYWELGLGMDIGMFGLEISGGYMDTKTGLVDVNTIPLLLTGRFQIPMGMFVPYAEAGIGAYFTEIDHAILPSNDETSFGVHTGLGCDFRFQRFFLGVEARYIWVKVDGDYYDVDLDGFIVTGNIGIRF
jgi:hypothetical protein